MRDIESEVQVTRHLIGKDRLDPRVLEVMRQVPRREFVPSDERSVAYVNGPLPIGYGQTISQPYIVALMTDLLAPAADNVILEVGAGSGYQTAVLARLVKYVYSIEQIPELADGARERLQRLGYHNAEIRCGDGYRGWPERAPFDGIIVTAAAPHIPRPLVEQLKPGARLVLPVGGRFYGQTLMLVERDFDGGLHRRGVLDVAFVPLTGNGHDQPAEITEQATE